MKVSRWYKARSQQAVHVQGGTPLRVLHVSLATRQIARLTPVNHARIQARRLQNAVQRQPIHARGLHMATERTPCALASGPRPAPRAGHTTAKSLCRRQPAHRRPPIHAYARCPRRQTQHVRPTPSESSSLTSESDYKRHAAASARSRHRKYKSLQREAELTKMCD